MVKGGVDVRKIMAEDELRANLSILVEGIAAATNMELLSSMLEKFGDIEGIRAEGPTDGETWACIVTFKTFDGARDAVEGMNGQFLGGTSAPIRVSFTLNDANAPVCRKRVRRHAHK